MAIHPYKPGELFRQLYLCNMEQNEESQECTEGGGEEDLKECHASTNNKYTFPCRPSESQPVKNKRKASESDLLTTAKKAKRYPKIKAWSKERVELLLRYLKDFKTKCEFNGIDFEADLTSMYTEIRRCLAVDFTQGCY